MTNRNITFSLPKEVAGKVESIAARRGISMSELLCGMLEGFIEEEKKYREAEANFLAKMDEGFDLGTGGDIGWTRDETHER